MENRLLNNVMWGIVTSNIEPPSQLPVTKRGIEEVNLKKEKMIRTNG